MYIKGIIDTLKEKGFVLHVLSVLPTGNTDDEKVEIGAVVFRNNIDIKILNDKIKEYSLIDNFNYIDVYNDLLDEKGYLNVSYSTEGLHLNEMGYYRMTRALLKHMDKAC
jgi:lysophospholipase L1-like esterase